MAHLGGIVILQSSVLSELCPTLAAPSVPVIAPPSQEPSVWVALVVVAFGGPYALAKIWRLFQGRQRAIVLTLFALMLVFGLVDVLGESLYARSMSALTEWDLNMYTQLDQNGCSTKGLAIIYSQTEVTIAQIGAVAGIADVGFLVVGLFAFIYLIWLVASRRVTPPNRRI